DRATGEHCVMLHRFPPGVPVPVPTRTATVLPELPRHCVLLPEPHPGPRVARSLFRVEPSPLENYRAETAARAAAPPSPPPKTRCVATPPWRPYDVPRGWPLAPYAPTLFGQLRRADL